LKFFSLTLQIRIPDGISNTKNTLLSPDGRNEERRSTMALHRCQHYDQEPFRQAPDPRVMRIVRNTDEKKESGNRTFRLPGKKQR